MLEVLSLMVARAVRLVSCGQTHDGSDWFVWVLLVGWLLFCGFCCCCFVNFTQTRATWEGVISMEECSHQTKLSESLWGHFLDW